MRHSFTTFASRSFLEAEIEEKLVIGMNGPAWPSLMFHVRLTLNYPFQNPGSAMELQELRCQLALDQGYVAAATPVLSTYRVTSEFKHSPDNLVHLCFPLDLRRLDFFERARKGGDMAMRLDLEAFGVELAEIGRTNGDYPRPIWGYKDRHRFTVQAPVVVARSDWLEKVLPQTGYGRVHLIELPIVPIEECVALKAAYDALMQAQKLQREGFFNEAAGMCRVALEPFFEPVDPANPASPKKLKSSYETRVAAATYDWLNASFIALKKTTNRSHHVTGAGFQAADTAMLLSITTALIAYAVRAETATASTSTTS
jgi:hypothetical protein